MAERMSNNHQLRLCDIYLVMMKAIDEDGLFFARECFVVVGSSVPYNLLFLLNALGGRRSNLFELFSHGQAVIVW